MHPRNFGSHVTVRPPAPRPSAPQVYQCKIIQSTGMATQMELEVFGAKSRGHPDFQREKQQLSSVFFRLSFSV